MPPLTNLHHTTHNKINHNRAVHSENIPKTTKQKLKKHKNRKNRLAAICSFPAGRLSLPSLGPNNTVLIHISQLKLWHFLFLRELLPPSTASSGRFVTFYAYTPPPLWVTSRTCSCQFICFCVSKINDEHKSRRWRADEIMDYLLCSIWRRRRLGWRGVLFAPLNCVIKFKVCLGFGS